MRRTFLILALVAVATLAFAGAAHAQLKPQFKLGFKALAEQIPDVVGEPVEEERWDSAGNLLQRTTTGLMMWRKSDRWHLFTNGAVTWILGPYGLQSRANDQLYPWEFVPPGPGPASPSGGEPASSGGSFPGVPTPVPLPPTPVPVAAPPPASPSFAAVADPSRTYVLDVRAMDDLAGGHGVLIKGFMQAIDEEWARVWGWRPHRPATIYLYMDGYGMASGLMTISGANLSQFDLDRIATVNATARGEDRQTGGWAIFMNLNYKWGSEDWESTLKTMALLEYTHVFMEDMAGRAGPEWFREGFAQWTAHSKVGGTPAEKSLLGYVMAFNSSGRLPGLSYLTTSWSQFLGAAPENVEAAYGASYLAVKYLAGRVGGMPLLQALQRTAAGESFDAALQATTGYSLQRLESEYRTTIPTS